MRLIYNGVDLAALGELRVLGESSVREPAEAPQRERVTVRVRLDVFEQSYADNRGLLEQLRVALRTQQAELVWEDGEVYTQRTVTVADDEVVEEPQTRGGTYWQALVFSFWYYNHDIRSNCLKGTAQVGEAEPLDLGAVLHWEERLRATLVDEYRDKRKLVTLGLTATGRWQADTKASLATRRAALLAQKDALMAALVQGTTCKVGFGTFNEPVRVEDFVATVDQPNHAIAWSLTGSLVRYPDPTNFTVLDLTVTLREDRGEGIPRVTLAGRIAAQTEAAARARYATLKAALAPAGYVCTMEETEARQGGSESGSGGDGLTFIDLRFTVQYRDPSTITCTFQRDGENTPLVDLGTVDHFSDRYQTTLFDEMKTKRRRTGGVVSLSGRWMVSDSLTPEQKRTVLLEKVGVLREQLTEGVYGRLHYGTAFEGMVKVVDGVAEINRAKHWIDWSLSANFTRFPNEADYALCEWEVSDRQNDADGTVVRSFAGRIGAPSGEAAREKLARLRNQVVPAGYVRLRASANDRWVEVESDKASEGAVYLEVSFAEEYQKAAADVLDWQLRVSDEDDARIGDVRTSYAGTVTAAGATAAAAFTTARAKAAALGDGKYPLRVRATVTSREPQVLTDGKVLVGVEFNYEYLRKGEKVYVAVTGELSDETFGLTTETVSGFVAAPTLAKAAEAYAQIRSSYGAALVMNERKPTQSQERLLNTDLAVIAAVDRTFPFSFQVVRAKGAVAMSYTIEPSSNFQTLEVTTQVRGVVRAASAEAAEAYLEAFLGELALGKRVSNGRSKEHMRGPRATGAGLAELFTGLNFTETYVGQLTGMAGILECEVTEEVVYSTDRIVAQPLPDGPSVLQRCGTTEGRRTVQCRCVATTETTGRNWVRGIRTALLTAEAQRYEDPPRIATTFRFLPQTEGVPRGDGANVRLYEVAGTFGEVVAELGLN